MNDTITMTKSFGETFVEGSDYYKTAKLTSVKKERLLSQYSKGLNNNVTNTIDNNLTEELTSTNMFDRVNISPIDYPDSANVNGRKKLGISKSIMNVIKDNISKLATFNAFSNEKDEVKEEKIEIEEIEEVKTEPEIKEEKSVSLSRTSMNEDKYVEEKRNANSPSIDDYFQSRKTSFDDNKSNEDDVLARLVQGNEEINHKIEQSKEYLDILKDKIKKKEIEDLQQQIEDNTQVLDNLMQQIREYENKLNEGKTR